MSMLGFLFVRSQTPDGKGNTAVTGDNQLQVMLSYFVLVALDLWRRGSGKLELDRRTTAGTVDRA